MMIIHSIRNQMYRHVGRAISRAEKTVAFCALLCGLLTAALPSAAGEEGIRKPVALSDSIWNAAMKAVSSESGIKTDREGALSFSDGGKIYVDLPQDKNPEYEVVRWGNETRIETPANQRSCLVVTIILDSKSLGVLGIERGP